MTLLSHSSSPSPRPPVRLEPLNLLARAVIELRPKEKTRISGVSLQKSLVIFSHSPVRAIIIGIRHSLHSLGSIKTAQLRGLVEVDVQAVTTVVALGDALPDVAGGHLLVRSGVGDLLVASGDVAVLILEAVEVWACAAFWLGCWMVVSCDEEVLGILMMLTSEGCGGHGRGGDDDGAEMHCDWGW